MNRFLGIAKRALVIVGVTAIGAAVGSKLYWQFHDRIPVTTPVGTVGSPHCVGANARNFFMDASRSCNFLLWSIRD